MFTFISAVKHLGSELNFKLKKKKNDFHTLEQQHSTRKTMPWNICIYIILFSLTAERCYWNIASVNIFVFDNVAHNVFY